MERFYGGALERRLKHPTVLAISSAAREELFPIRPTPRKPPTGKLDSVDEADAAGTDRSPGEEP